MNSNMNLLAETRQEKQRSRYARRRWRLALATLILGLACWSWFEYRTLNVLAAERDALERQFTPLKSAKANIKRIAATCEQLRAKEQLAIALSHHRPALSFFEVIETAASECRGELFIKELIYLRQSVNVGRTPASDRPSSLTIRGLSENNLAIAKFAASLRDSRLFSSVEMTASESQEIDKKAVQEFELNCAFARMGSRQ